MYKEMIEQAALNGHDIGLGTLLEKHLTFYGYDEQTMSLDNIPLETIITPELLAKVLTRIEDNNDPRLNIFNAFANNAKPSFVMDNAKLKSCAWMLFIAPEVVEEHLDHPIEWYITEKGLYSLLEDNEGSQSPIAIYLNAKEIKELVNNSEEQLAIEIIDRAWKREDLAFNGTALSYSLIPLPPC